MPLMQCEKHGWRGAELGAEAVISYVEKDSSDSKRVVLLSLIWEGLEFSIVALNSEIPLPNTTEIDGLFHVPHEEDLNEILEKLKPMCAECLKAHLENS
jgi:hypothetical protein